MNKKTHRFYYGWVIVAVSSFTLFLSIGTRSSFGVYYIAILGEYGWGRAETAGAFSLEMLFHAIFAPVTGTLIDRYGPRKLFPLGAFLLFLGLLAASRISTILHLYLFFGVVMAIGINIISYSPHMAVILKWFIRKRGLASGLVLSGVGLGSLVLIPFNELMIDAMGWRSAFFVLSCIILCILLPVTAIFHRRSPEEIGQYPDGIVQDETPLCSQSKNDAVSSSGLKSWSFKSAVRVRAFWFMVLVVMCEGFIINVLLVHQAVFMVDMGYSKLLAASLVGLVGILGSAGGILCGFLSDRIGSKAGYTLGGILAFAGILFLLFMKDCNSPWMVYAFAVLYGLGNGGKMPMIATITGSLFPGNALGRILSIQSIGFGIGGAIGAYIGGFFYDQMGTYFIPFLLILTSNIFSILFVWMATMKRYRPAYNPA
ncbi:MAG: MFS transporter [Deltaproteobacteria bacterium]|nr:MFS transporter [Deltaproteobacteria bacterium]